MTAFSLVNKTILVTGASSGIGRQTAISISEMGGKVILTARNKENLEATYNQLKGNGHQLIIADLLNEAACTSLIEQIEQIDGVVHSAGKVTPYPIQYIDDKKIAETFDLNYHAPVKLMAQLTRKKKLNPNASIVFLSSISAQHPHKGGSLYSGSKAALESYSKVVALELFPKGIRANCIAAGMVKTPLYAYAEKDASKEIMDAHVAKYPLGVGLPEDVAHAIVFLLSDASRWITGTTLTLDGGFLLGGI
jgi:NAD(P)-dependent dehydrogenase (short-subunit alcohol dehydrogenase family)